MKSIEYLKLHYNSVISLVFLERRINTIIIRPTPWVFANYDKSMQSFCSNNAFVHSIYSINIANNYNK